MLAMTGTLSRVANSFPKRFSDRRTLHLLTKASFFDYPSFTLQKRISCKAHTAAAQAGRNEKRLRERLQTPRNVTLPFNGLTAHQVSVLLGRPLPQVLSASREIDSSVKNEPSSRLSPAVIELIADSLGCPMQMRQQNVPLHRTSLSKAKSIADSRKELPLRSPIVAVMGHVDVGKTTLLDTLRHSNIAKQERGGITQRIGAFRVSLPPSVALGSSLRNITFIDTPGHEAFTSMRAHGADATDVVVLVVAADDGVMPQTIEAVNIARSAGVPMVVAINKCDKEGADPDRARSQLLEMANVNTEDLGGDVLCVEISALEGRNIDDLLEAVLLQAEMLGLHADPNTPGNGVCLESRIDRTLGNVATLIIRSGTIRTGDSFVFSSLEKLHDEVYGRVRSLSDVEGNFLSEAGPGDAVVISGFRSAISPGTELMVVKDEREAKRISGEIVSRNRDAHSLIEMIESATDLSDQIEKGDSVSGAGNDDTGIIPIPSSALESSMSDAEGPHDSSVSNSVSTIYIVVKADVQGSVDAVVQCLQRISSADTPLRILRSGLGDVTENDVVLASVTRKMARNQDQFVVVAFNVHVKQKAISFAKRNETKIISHALIYKLEESLLDFKKSLTESQQQIEAVLGVAGVLKVFDNGTIAGCLVQNGDVEVGKRGRVLRFPRDKASTKREVAYEGIVESIKHFSKDVKVASKGSECGISLRNWNGFVRGDVIECVDSANDGPKPTGK